MSGDGLDGGKVDAVMIKEGGETPPIRGRSYSQAEVDALVAGKLEGFAGVDVAEYRSLKEAKARQERKALEKRGDFEKILAQTVKEKDEVIGLREKDIAALGEQLRTIRVDNALLAAASAAKAISPAQIVTLLKGSVHYDQKSDSVEVREHGAPLYRGGKPVSVELFVQEFLQANPHFLPAGPLGSGAGGGTGVAGAGGCVEWGFGDGLFVGVEYAVDGVDGGPVCDFDDSGRGCGDCFGSGDDGECGAGDWCGAFGDDNFVQASGTGDAGLMAKYLKFLNGQTIADDLLAPLVKGYSEAVVTANTSASYTVDIALATIFLLTVNSSSVTLSFPAPAAGKSFVVSVRWSTSGAVTWPATVKWAGGVAPMLTGTVGKADNVGFWSDGANWYGSVMGQNYMV